MKTIVVTNRKGGVGKTTVATHLAGGLALRGLRVAIVDTDPQGHVALSFGMPKENGLFMIMTEEDTEFADVVRQPDPVRFMPPGYTGKNTLYLLPSSKGTTVIPIEQPSPFKFKEVLEDMGELLSLDVIVVDTGPTASMFDGSVNFAADYFVHVTECESLSFDGLVESLNEIERINSQNTKYRASGASILGIIPNKMRAGTSNHRENIRELAEAFPGMVWHPLVQRTIWGEASKYGQLVFSYAPEGQEAADAMRVVDNVMKKAGL
ncbi:MAG: ParA family protein [Aggregatilineales bacterium]